MEPSIDPQFEAEHKPPLSVQRERRTILAFPWILLVFVAGTLIGYFGRPYADQLGLPMLPAATVRAVSKQRSLSQLQQ